MTNFWREVTKKTYLFYFILIVKGLKAYFALFLPLKTMKDSAIRAHRTASEEFTEFKG